MKNLSEDQIIKIFQTSFGNKKFISEDVEFFRIGNIGVVFKIDTLVASTDVPPRMDLTDVARKSVVACVSDFASKGVKPLYGFVSVIIPRKFSVYQIKKLAKGFEYASKEFGLKMIGGDTNEGKELSLNVCLFGITNDIPKRDGASKGDLIFVSGPFGYTAAGLQILLKNKKSNKKFANIAKKHVLHPKVNLDFGLAIKKFLSSSMDSSDGLSTSLNELSKQSKKKFLITNIPTKQEVIDFASSNKLNQFDLIFNGGEEYEIVFTVPPKNQKAVIKLAKRMKIPLILIGKVVSGRGVVLEQNNKKMKIVDKGWHHLI